MAIIGEQLIQPEAGWTRYDVPSILAIVKGTSWGKEVNDIFYGGSSIWLKSTDSSYKFKFYGNKLRLISDKNTNRPQNNIKVTIDGVEYIADSYSNTAKAKVLAIDLSNLGSFIHEVVISPVNEGFVVIDCIDINSDGYIINPYLEENKDINKLKVGEYIPCNFSFSNGFTNFHTGKDINFICVSHKDRQSILISNIAVAGFSFNEINQKGFIYGNELDNQPYKDNIFIIRSLTGGVNNNGLSEYDKYIVNSDLNGLITPGDKNIWNWGHHSITSSISASDNSKMIIRGYSSLTNYETDTFSKQSLYGGFRPVLIVKHLYVDPLFEINQFGNFDNCFNITNIILDVSIKIPKVSVNIINTTNSKILISTELINVIDNSLNIDYTFNKNDFELNKMNVLKITLTDENYFDTSININTFPIEDKLFIFNNSITSTVIENKHNKDRMIICANTKDNCVALYLNNNNYIEANLEDYISINQDTKLKFLLDKNSDLMSYGLAFI